MDSAGIIRKVDPLGRIVIPREIRREMRINEGDELEVIVNEDKVIMKKHISQNTCLITGKTTNNMIKLMDGKIVLSKEGARMLRDELRKELKKHFKNSFQEEN
jgi:transcriptional pleiotropic regulator of transition state genes